MRPIDTRRPDRGGSRFAWPLFAAMLAGIAVGIAVPRPFEAARAAQQPPPPVLAAQPSDEARAPAGADPAQTDPTASTDEEPAPPIATRTFEAPAAMVMNYVRSGSAQAFESLTRRMVEALAASEDAEHQALAAGWTMYRVADPGPNNNAVYVWLFDPVVENANYAVAQILNQLFPAEVQQLYETYMQSFGIGQTPLELEPVPLVEDPG